MRTPRPLRWRCRTSRACGFVEEWVFAIISVELHVLSAQYVVPLLYADLLEVLGQTAFVLVVQHVSVQAPATYVLVMKRVSFGLYVIDAQHVSWLRYVNFFKLFVPAMYVLMEQHVLIVPYVIAAQ